MNQCIYFPTLIPQACRLQTYLLAIILNYRHIKHSFNVPNQSFALPTPMRARGGKQQM